VKLERREAWRQEVSLPEKNENSFNSGGDHKSINFAAGNDSGSGQGIQINWPSNPAPTYQQQEED